MSSAAGPSSRNVGNNAESILSLAQLSLGDDDSGRRQIDRLRHGDGTPMSDAEIALALSAEEARLAIMFDNDRALAQVLQDEERERDAGRTIPRAPPPIGRPAVAPALQRPPQRVAPPETTNTSPTSWVGGWLWSFVNPFINSSADSSAPSAPPTATSSRLAHNCVICQDPIRGVEVRTPCGHYYDKTCIIDLFRAATGDESLFPPRCCRLPIPFAPVQLHLTRELVALFREKEKEFGTLKRVYCANPSCSRFLGPVQEGWFKATISCPSPRCSTRTCNGCKGQVNSTWHSCKPDDKDQDVLALSRSANWARCPGCDQMIELSMGCYHMTCRCKTEFCYLCRARWKTCACAQWDENRLLHAAERRVDAQLAANRGPPPPARRVEQPVQPIARPANVPLPYIARVRPPVVHPPPATVRRNEDIRGLLDTFNGRQGSSHPSGHTTTVRRPSLSTGVAGVASPSSPALVPAVTSRSHISAAVKNEQLRAEAAARIEERRRRPRPISQNNSVNQDELLRTEALRRIAARRSGLTLPTPSSPSNTLASTARATIQDNSRGTSTATAVRRPNSAINPVDLHRARLIQEAVEELRVNHDCKHENWRFRRGGGGCETCHHKLPHYLFRCLGCQTLACNRCRRNRL